MGQAQRGCAHAATMTPQEAIKKGLPTPAQCNIVIVIFRSRMGTPLPAEWKKQDGTGYLSGTEWDYLNALEAAECQGKPEVLVYRRSEKISRREEITMSEFEIRKPISIWNKELKVDFK